MQREDGRQYQSRRLTYTEDGPNRCITDYYSALCKTSNLLIFRPTKNYEESSLAQSLFTRIIFLLQPGKAQRPFAINSLSLAMLKLLNDFDYKEPTK